MACHFETILDHHTKVFASTNPVLKYSQDFQEKSNKLAASELCTAKSLKGHKKHKSSYYEKDSQLRKQFKKEVGFIISRRRVVV